MPVTIKDVAREAGVSVSTVSKVINGHYSISAATAERVRETMRALQYYPNASAQSFARGATRRVVLLADMYRNIAFENPHMFEIFAGVEESLRRRGVRAGAARHRQDGCERRGGGDHSAPRGRCSRRACFRDVARSQRVIDRKALPRTWFSVCQAFPVRCAGWISTTYIQASLPRRTWSSAAIGELLSSAAGTTTSAPPTAWREFVKGWRMPVHQ